MNFYNKIINENNLLDYCNLVIRSAKNCGAKQAEFALGISNSSHVAVNNKKIDTIENFTSQVGYLNMYSNGKKSSARITNIFNCNINSLINKSIGQMDYIERDYGVGLADKSYMAKEINDYGLYNPMDMNIKNLIDLAFKCEEFSYKFDNRIISSENISVCYEEKIFIYLNSNEFIGVLPATEFGVSCSLIATENDKMERDYCYDYSVDFDLLEPLEKIARTAAKKAISRLNSRKIKTQTCPVIFLPEVASELLSIFIGLISGENIYKKKSIFCDFIGKKIFPEFINIFENPFLYKKIGSRSFDNDGVYTRKNIFIDNGILKNYVLDSYCSKKLNMETTGNSGGVHNLFIENKHQKVFSRNELIGMMGKGVIVSELLGHGINFITGDFSYGMAGFYVDNGIIEYPISEVTISGNIVDMFKNILAISSDIPKNRNINTGSILIEKMVLSGN